MNLGQLLRQKRKQKNMSQTDVAKHIGVSTNTISKYERNLIENMGREKAIALSKLLDIPVVWFIEAIEGKKFMDSEKVSPREFFNEVASILNKTDGLSDQQKKHILNTLEFICSDDKK
jgi:transcriptional regulator with XRE-family HTH domain